MYIFYTQLPWGALTSKNMNSIPDYASPMAVQWQLLSVSAVGRPTVLQDAHSER